MLIVGFDFDGVVIYNPLHIARAPIAWFKSKFLRLNKTSFYKPKNKFQLFIWKLLFLISIPATDGLKEIQKLKDEGKIYPILLTGRFDLSQKKLREILKNIGFPTLFSEIITNDKNEQPHIFKERLIQEKKMQVYIEDNIDIVLYLNKTLPQKASSQDLTKKDNLRNNSYQSSIPHHHSHRLCYHPSKNRLSNQPTPVCQIFWIYNIVDKKFDYFPKFPTLRQAVKNLYKNL